MLIGAPAAQARQLATAAPAPDALRVPAQLTRPIGPARPPHPVPPRTPLSPRGGRGGLPEYVRHLDVVQTVRWQLAALTVLLTVQRPWPVLVCACVGAALLVALTTVRIGGRWLYQVAGLAAGFLSRPRRRDLPETGGPPSRWRPPSSPPAPPRPVSGSPDSTARIPPASPRRFPIGVF